MLGANLPDVDVACYFVSSDFALAHRRGWTHGVLAMAVLPVVLALLVLGVARLVERARKRPAASLPPFRRLLFLSAVGVWSHPLLDWLNTYGVRFLAPFDWSWFYGDSVFIVDPWIWLLLAGGLFFGREAGAGGHRRPGRRGPLRRPADRLLRRRPGDGPGGDGGPESGDRGP